MTRTAVIDTETTGNVPLEVIELGYIFLGDAYEENPVAVVRRYKPERPSHIGAIAVHHIFDRELRANPPSSQAKLPEEVTYIIGHNVDYDWEALGKPDVKRICTLALARARYPNLDTHRLSALAYHLLGELDSTRNLVRRAHGAGADATVCYLILQKMLHDEMPPIETLWQMSEEARIPKIILFGKHRGKKLTEIPRDYIQWLLRQPELDPYLEKALKAL
jgi:exodeoxyribonuclease X